MPLAPEELVAVLCGWPLVTGDAVRAEPRAGHVLLEVRDGVRTTSARVVAGAAVSRASVRHLRGGYEVEWRDRLPVDGAIGPGDLKLSSDQPPVRIELSWSEAEANAPLEASLFELRPPAGARVVDLDASGPAPSLLPDEAP
jgi:hypothetical protein